MFVDNSKKIAVQNFYINELNADIEDIKARIHQIFRDNERPLPAKMDSKRQKLYVEIKEIEKKINFRKINIYKLSHEMELHPKLPVHNSQLKYLDNCMLVNDYCHSLFI